MSKILIVVERFHPEDFLVNDLASEWKRRGDEVEVLTQVPSYPFDKIYDGYVNRRMQTTTELNGIPVHRVNTIFGYNTSVKRKVLNYLHFGWRTMCWALWHGRQYDRVFVYHTAALTMAMSVWPLRLIWRKPITIWTQDLWPDAVYAFGFRPVWWKAAILNTFVRSIYGCCTRITVSCPAYVKRIKELTGRGAEFVPQWDPTPMEIAPKVPDGKTVFMFAGNFGVPQDLENVVEGFKKAGVPNAELWMVGGGVMLERLKELSAGCDAIKFCGRQPKAEMPKWFAKADALIISLNPEYQLTLPGKFQSYIKTGRPLMGILYGDARMLIEEHHLGITANPEAVDAIAEAFRQMAAMIANGEGVACGKNGIALSEGEFQRDRAMARLYAM